MMRPQDVNVIRALEDAKAALDFSLEQVSGFDAPPGVGGRGGFQQLNIDGSGGRNGETQHHDLGAIYTPEMWDTEDVVVWLGWTGTRQRSLHVTHACYAGVDALGAIYANRGKRRGKK